ncbi:MAG: asparaginase domain-containing protein, partial [Candidatus Thermoplasmatota archaeon]
GLMHGETGDTFALVHRGTKVRKMHSSRRDAFRSINAAPLGKVHHDGRVDLREDAKPRTKGPVAVDTRLDPSVVLIYFFPGMKAHHLEALLEDSHGAVIAGTGLGHTAHDLIPAIAKAVRAGKPIVMTSQTLYGRVGMRVYDTGRDLLSAGVISGEDMLPETAFVKLMWILGHTHDPVEVAREIATAVAGEINPRIRLDEFEE